MSAPVRSREVLVHPMIYRAYLVLYLESCALLNRMDAVLDSRLHQAIMAEAIDRGFVMPDVESMREKTNALRLAIAMSPDPHDVRLYKNNMLLMPVKTACAFYNVAARGQDIVEDVFYAIEKTQYLPWFTVLKKRGEPYAGPTSLQEVFNVWANLERSASSEKKYAAPNALPRSWFDAQP